MKKIYIINTVFLVFTLAVLVSIKYLYSYILFYNLIDIFTSSVGIVTSIIIYMNYKNSKDVVLFFIGSTILFLSLSQSLNIFSDATNSTTDFISETLKFIAFWFIFYGVILNSPHSFKFTKNNKDFKDLEKDSQKNSDIIEKNNDIIELYEKVFINTSNAIVITDNKNKILKVNNAFTTITEYQADEVVGKDPQILKSGRHSEEFYKKMWASLYKFGYWNGEIWNKKKYGGIYPQWLSISMIKSKESGKVQHYISNFSDISIIKESQDALEYMAHHDGLTGLVNRVLLKSHLDNFVKTRKRDRNIGAVLYLDLDKFKFVNDTYGHAIGDEILQSVAKRLTDSVRNSDIVARVGGDEFIIILSQAVSKESIKYVAEKIVSAISDSFENIVDDPIYIGTSIGIAIFPEQSSNVDNIIKYADIAMFEAKKRGRNGYQFYYPNMSKDLLEKTSIERDLRSAVLSNEFILHYQPQVDAEKSRVISAEALIRWKHPTIGLMPPIKFINIAEESELIIEIGKWVIFQACSQMVKWKKDNIFIEKISVNVSTIQFLKSDMVQTVKDVLEKTGCDPHDLELEITESVLIENKESMLKTLEALGSLGVEFAIDDFGTGYSSLSYLKQLPFHTIKIDRSFVAEIPYSQDDIAITKSVVALGKSFNYKVIAEGVETKEQLEFLKNLHCDLIQGFYYSKPMSAKDFANFYKELEVKSGNQK